MASENETIADILAEIRGANFQPPYYQERIDEIANRIEAAWKRESKPKPLTIAEWTDRKETIKDIAANLRRYVLPSVADKLDAIAKRLYSEIDTAICSIDEASNTDIENIRKIMDENLGDYYE